MLPIRRLVPAFAIALLSSLGAAAAQDCPQAAPVLGMRAAATVTLNTRAPIAALGTHVAKLAATDIVGGETVIERQASYDDEAPVVRAADGHGFCARLVLVTVTIKDVARTVRIARELAGDACLRRAIVAHEDRHLRAADAAEAAALAGLQGDLDGYLAGHALRASPDARTAAATLKRTLDAWFAGWRARLTADVARRNAAIDTDEEARRLGAICGRRALAAR